MGVKLPQVDCEGCCKTYVKGYSFKCDMNCWHYYCLKCSEKFIKTGQGEKQ